MTGMRRGELLGLKWDDVDFENKSISITRNLVKTSKGVQIGEVKTEKSKQSVTTSEMVIQTLRAHRATQALVLLMARLRNT